MSIQSNFTKNGNKLIAKISKETVSKVHPAIKHLETLPSEAKTFDLALIERKFGRERVKIFSFRNTDGKLIKRIQEVDGNKKQIIESNYYYDRFSREIMRKTKENNNIIKEVFENISTLSKEAISKTSLTREFVNDKRIKSNEKHFFGSFPLKTSSKQSVIEKLFDYFNSIPKPKPKKFIANLQRNEDNSVKITKIQYSGISKDDAKEITKDPYLSMRLLPFNDFIAAVKPRAYLNQGIEKANIKTFKANLGNSQKSPIAEAEKRADGTIRILLNKQNTQLQSKPNVVSSFNHEAKHCRQFIYMDQLEYTQHFPLISMNPNVSMRQFAYGKLNDEQTIEYAKKIQEAANNYASASENPTLYHNNFLEIEARTAGEKAEKEYIDYAQKLKTKIALTSKQLGLSN